MARGLPWKGGKIEAERAELEVGTELVVQLPVPGAARPEGAADGEGASRPRPSCLREQLAAETRSAGSSRSARQVEREADTLARLRAERDAAREEAERARADGERLVNDEYRQRERALAATEEAPTPARGGGARASPSASSAPPAEPLRARGGARRH